MGKWSYSLTILNLGIKWRRVARCTPLALYPQHPLARGTMASRTGKETLLCPAGNRIAVPRPSNTWSNRYYDRAAVVFFRILFLLLWLYSLDRFFSSLTYTQSVGHLGRGISPSQGRCLHIREHKQNKCTETSMP
jgi:hypothetical protein